MLIHQTRPGTYSRQIILPLNVCSQRIQVGLMTLGLQLVWLLVLGFPVASIAWTVTHEEVLREPRQYCLFQAARAKSIVRRKFFYLFTCEYCFSHYVAAGFLAISRYKLLFLDWRGYLVASFRARLGCEPIHEHLQPAATRH